MATISKPVNDSIREYGRGLTGGLLFSLPMLYTMELWWTGFIARPIPLLLYFVVGIFLLLIYNHYVGIRNEHSIRASIIESVEEMGVALLLTIFILWVTARITIHMSIIEIGGKVIIEAVTVAIGISVGKTQLSGSGNREADGRETEKSDKEQEEQAQENQRTDDHLLRSISLALCGAILVASNIAPTDEVVVIALESEIYKIILIAVISIGIGGSVLYHLNFKGSKEWIVQPDNPLDFMAGTAIMYAVALLSSAFMLWFFGRFEDVSVYAMVAQTVVLSFPGTLGASAGRLLIQS